MKKRDDLTAERLGVRDPAQAEALAWLLTVAEDPAAEEACAAWRRADPAHERAWREVEAAWRKTGALGAIDRADWRAEIDRLGSRPYARPPVWALAAAACLAVAVALPFWPRFSLHASTRTAELRELALNDGSRVSLSPRSRIDVRFAAAGRQAVLADGEAFFQVAHDRSRPFVVRAGDAEIRVTGTRFDVRNVGGEVRVAVLDGRVEVRRRTLPIPSYIPLPAGRPQGVLTAGEMSELAPGEAAFSPARTAAGVPGAWRNGRLVYVETPLAEVLADIRRYTPTEIRLADPQAARLKVTMSFDVAQLQGFLQDLPAVLPVRESRTRDGAVVLSSTAAADATAN